MLSTKPELLSSKSEFVNVGVRARDSIMMCETGSKCERLIVGGGKGVDDMHLRQEQS